jgi:hypothetical protein
MMSMTRRKKLIFMIPIGIAAMVLAAFLGGSIVKWLWNALLPPLFGLPAVTYWQALGLLALSRILFGGFSSCGRGRMRGAMRERMEERMVAMTPEERERFRAALRAKLGLAPQAGETKPS